ncbi:hypothetical protein [Streptomyces sp. CdTB01]|uniref:hypothetical protein n=1 Tax=Streptomyces sp. CdTB01 TaxID=1725411 RepID=UPI00073ACE4A|nr:hypothetical protein [Streptomyces sp. CdTB01]ALV33127.1 hypothetical protein AS200_14535 [Streptomyces sp. CdTB01]
MPRESVGRAQARGPAFVLLLGLALTLMAHLVACAAHATEDHRPAVAAVASAAQEEHGADAHPLLSAGPACSVSGGADDHPEHDVLCCDPADTPVSLRAAAGTTLLALLLLVLSSLGRRPEDLAVSGAPPGRAETSDARAYTGSALLRIVCVSRT